MALRVAINGFGRIGRLVLRTIVENNDRDIDVVVINGTGEPKSWAHLVKYDSVHGRMVGDITHGDDFIDVGRGPIAMIQQRDATKIDWTKYGVDIVLECTGKYTEREKAMIHVEQGGAKRVLISAPGKNADKTIVYGVNQDLLTKDDIIISCASCTTNCLAPVAKVLHDAVGIERGFMTTIHSYTGDQPTLDKMHKDLYRARNAASSMIPTSTGAAKAIGLVLPELAGKLDGSSIRVPTPNVSAVDLVFTPERDTTAEEINDAIKTAVAGPMKGILEATEEPLVSIDINHNEHSSVFALPLTQVMDGKLVRILSWYDNEWGFSNRMVDLAKEMGKYL